MGWNQAVVESPEKVDVMDLDADKGEHLVPPGPASEEIGLTTLQLPGTGTTQDELEASVLDEPMDLIKDAGYLLDLIKDDRFLERGGVGRQQPLTKQGRPFREVEEQIGAQEVEDQAPRKPLPQEGGLPHLPGAPQKSRLTPGKVKIEDAVVMDHYGGYSEIILPYRDNGPVFPGRQFQ